MVDIDLWEHHKDTLGHHLGKD
ncbi:hypothetical protein C5167_032952 [Papaver somniferum]|uniref:Uncharacterized protein n=1 Tax=Papaver somniferum TaxID=3469 RepID=A0A4Y7KAH4_PAPSO|nr:hypothetical protein C5167_032952 [Papaver somniferum]